MSLSVKNWECVFSEPARGEARIRLEWVMQTYVPYDRLAMVFAVKDGDEPVLGQFVMDRRDADNVYGTNQFVSGRATVDPQYGGTIWWLTLNGVNYKVKPAEPVAMRRAEQVEVTPTSVFFTGESRRTFGSVERLFWTPDSAFGRRYWWLRNLNWFESVHDIWPANLPEGQGQVMVKARTITPPRVQPYIVDLVLGGDDYPVVAAEK